MKVKPFYIQITNDMTPQMVQDAFDKCHRLGVRASNNDDIENLFDWGYFGVCAKDGTYFSDSYQGFYDATEITLDQLDGWLGISQTEPQEERETLDMIDTTSKQVERLSNYSSDWIPNWAKWRVGDKVEKIKGSAWKGKIVGYYSTDLTSFGYAVESSSEKGSVQIYPEAALRSAETSEQKAERERREEAEEMIQCLLDNYTDCEESAVDYVLEYLHECDYRKAK